MSSQRRLRLPRSVQDAELVLQNPAIRRAAEALTAYLRGEADEPRLVGLDDDLLAIVQRHARKQAADPFDETQFVRKMNELRPAAIHPVITDPPYQLYSALAQPEVLDGFWPLIDARGGARGPHPGIGAKAFLFTVATVGQSPHFDANHHLLAANHRLQDVFRAIEAKSALATGREPRPLQLRSYEQTLRQLHDLCERVSIDDCIRTNVELVRAAHALLGVKKTRLAIDASLWKAWVAQVGTRPPKREAEICRVATNAKPRLLEDRERPGKGRFIRGYQLVALVDLATGLPLTWTLWPANHDEAKALKHLLFTLYDLWPDLRADAVVADAAWDEQWAAEWTLRNYGLHLVARRYPSRLDTVYPLTPFESQAISAFRGDGSAICREHGVPTVRDGYEGRRDGLAPGEEAPATRFRLRYRCPVDGKRLSLHMHRHWTALAYHPHRLAAGNPALHAERLALLAYRNKCEALFSALQIGHTLGLGSAHRTRTAKEPTVEALLSVALMMRSALLLSNERQRQSIAA